jgi:hypothetical protein
MGRFALDSPYAKECLERGWANQEELECISAAWNAWAIRTNAFLAFARCEAVGWKE